MLCRSNRLICVLIILIGNTFSCNARYAVLGKIEGNLINYDCTSRLHQDYKTSLKVFELSLSIQTFINLSASLNRAFQNMKICSNALYSLIYLLRLRFGMMHHVYRVSVNAIQLYRHFIHYSSSVNRIGIILMSFLYWSLLS